MNRQSLIAIVLLVAGVLGLFYGGFTYSTDRHQVDLGAIQLSVDEKKSVNVPLWAGIGLLVAGSALLVGTKK